MKSVIVPPPAENPKEAYGIFQNAIEMERDELFHVNLQINKSDFMPSISRN